MTRALKRHPLISLSLLLLLSSVCLALWLLQGERVRADNPGPANILVSSVTIQPPVSGGSAYVSGYVSGTAPMTVWARSVTRDNLLNNGVPQWGNPITYVPNGANQYGSFYGYVTSGYGDLIEVKALNYYYQSFTDIKQVGYVPAGSDTAPPEFTPEYITETYGGTLYVTINAYYGLYDPSYPITTTLMEESNPANKHTVTIASTSDYPKTLGIIIGANQKARLHATDNYGNGQSLLYNSSQLNLSAATGSFTPEPTPAGAERTGNNPVGGIGVLLHNGGFLYEAALFQIRGRVLSLPITAAYRSRVSYDGPMGKNWGNRSPGERSIL